MIGGVTRCMLPRLSGVPHLHVNTPLDPTTQRQRERKKNNRFNKQNNNVARASHLFVLYISLPFLHHYNVKMPNFAYYGEFIQVTTKFYFSIWTWIWSLGIQLQEGSRTFDKVSG